MYVYINVYIHTQEEWRKELIRAPLNTQNTPYLATTLKGPGQLDA